MTICFNQECAKTLPAFNWQWNSDDQANQPNTKGNIAYLWGTDEQGRVIKHVLSECFFCSKNCARDQYTAVVESSPERGDFMDSIVFDKHVRYSPVAELVKQNRIQMSRSILERMKELKLELKPTVEEGSTHRSRRTRTNPTGQAATANPFFLRSGKRKVRGDVKNKEKGMEAGAGKSASKNAGKSASKNAGASSSAGEPTGEGSDTYKDDPLPRPSRSDVVTGVASAPQATSREEGTELEVGKSAAAAASSAGKPTGGGNGTSTSQATSGLKQAAPLGSTEQDEEGKSASNAAEASSTIVTAPSPELEVGKSAAAAASSAGKPTGGGNGTSTSQATSGLKQAAPLGSTEQDEEGKSASNAAEASSTIVTAPSPADGTSAHQAAAEPTDAASSGTRTPGTSGGDKENSGVTDDQKKKKTTKKKKKKKPPLLPEQVPGGSLLERNKAFRQGLEETEKEIRARKHIWFGHGCHNSHLWSMGVHGLVKEDPDIFAPTPVPQGKELYPFHMAEGSIRSKEKTPLPQYRIKFGGKIFVLNIKSRGDFELLPMQLKDGRAHLDFRLPLGFTHGASGQSTEHEIQLVEEVERLAIALADSFGGGCKPPIELNYGVRHLDRYDLDQEYDQSFKEVRNLINMKRKVLEGISNKWEGLPGMVGVTHPARTLAFCLPEENCTCKLCPTAVYPLVSYVRSNLRNQAATKAFDPSGSKIFGGDILMNLVNAKCDVPAPSYLLPLRTHSIFTTVNHHYANRPVMTYAWGVDPQSNYPPNPECLLESQWIQENEQVSTQEGSIDLANRCCEYIKLCQQHGDSCDSVATERAQRSATTGSGPMATESTEKYRTFSSNNIDHIRKNTLVLMPPSVKDEKEIRDIFALPNSTSPDRNIILVSLCDSNSVTNWGDDATPVRAYCAIYELPYSWLATDGRPLPSLSDVNDVQNAFGLRFKAEMVKQICPLAPMLVPESSIMHEKLNMFLLRHIFAERKRKGAEQIAREITMLMSARIKKNNPRKPAGRNPRKPGGPKTKRAKTKNEGSEQEDEKMDHFEEYGQGSSPPQAIEGTNIDNIQSV